MFASDGGRLLVTDGNRVAGLITRFGIARCVQVKTRWAN